MAFTRTEMAVMAYNAATPEAHRLIFYGNSAGDAVTGAGFFNPFADELTVGDLIYDVSSRAFFAVDSITDGVVVLDSVTTNPA